MIQIVSCCKHIVSINFSQNFTIFSKQIKTSLFFSFIKAAYFDFSYIPLFLLMNRETSFALKHGSVSVLSIPVTLVLLEGFVFIIFLMEVPVDDCNIVIVLLQCPPGRICFLIIFLMEGPVDDCNSGFFKSTLCPFHYLSIVVTPGSCQVPVNGVQMFENVFVVL